MSTTEHLGITLLEDESDPNFMDWAKSVNGTEESSMAKIVDAAFNNLNNKEVYSEEEPPGQNNGDTWYEVLTADDRG